ncbi:MAG: hypothetical protein FWG65_00965 [Turicibacter sp.]|nr:hypothetical protein [Turicibacter sp.]
MAITTEQTEKLLKSSDSFTQLGFSMLVSRLRQMYKIHGASVIKIAEEEINAFLKKYAIIMDADFALIESTY